MVAAIPVLLAQKRFLLVVRSVQLSRNSLLSSSEGYSVNTEQTNILPNCRDEQTSLQKFAWKFEDIV